MKSVEVLKDCRSLNAAAEMNCPMPRSVEKVPIRNEKRCNWPVARQFCSAFFMLNWSIETRRALIDYSFRILTNANTLFSILKSLKTTFLKRSLIGCDVKLTSQDMVTWQLYQPISGIGLCQYRMASTYLLPSITPFLIANRHLFASDRQIALVSSAGIPLRQRSPHIDISAPL